MIIHGHQRGSIQNLLEKAKNININIRWGGPQVRGALNGQVNLLNGLEQLRAFKEAGVPCPQFTTNLQEARKWVDSGAIVFGRNLEHTQGKDIVLPGDRRWLQKDFWTIYTPSLTEWRFHILNGMCIARGCKVFVPEPKHPRPANQRSDGKLDKSPLIRSRRLGWRLDHSVEPPDGVRGIAKNAVKAVKYDLGAVDMLFLGNGQAQVLEVNSRPAIRDDYTIGQYCKYLKKVESGRGE